MTWCRTIGAQFNIANIFDRKQSQMDFSKKKKSKWLRLIHLDVWSVCLIYFFWCVSGCTYVIILLREWIVCIELNTHFKQFQNYWKLSFRMWNVEWAHLLELLVCLECMFGIDSERIIFQRFRFESFEHFIKVKILRGSNLKYKWRGFGLFELY